MKNSPTKIAKTEFEDFLLETRTLLLDLKQRTTLSFKDNDHQVSVNCNRQLKRIRRMLEDLQVGGFCIEPEPLPKEPLID